MTTSTPLTWKWLDECEVPAQVYQHMTSETPSEMCRNYRESELSIYSHKLPYSDALRKRNDSGTEPGMSSSTTRKLDPEDSTPESAWAYMASQVGATGCESTAQMANVQSNAAQSHRIGTCYLDPDTGETVMPADFFGEKELRWTHTATASETTAPADSSCVRCPVCRHEMETDEGVLCDHCEETIGGVESFAVVNGPGGVFVYHLRCYDMAYWGAKEEEPPPQNPAEAADTFDVPFPVQSWLFEALIETEIERLHEIIDDHHDEIVKMARRRHRTGHVLHGSKGYQWDAKTRLRNVLEELSDGGTYLTMGPIE